jgi:hypothetical protein
VVSCHFDYCLITVFFLQLICLLSQFLLICHFLFLYDDSMGWSCGINNDWSPSNLIMSFHYFRVRHVSVGLSLGFHSSTIFIFFYLFLCYLYLLYFGWMQEVYNIMKRSAEERTEGEREVCLLFF